MKEIISFLLGSFSTTVIFVFFITHPHKFEKWVSMIWWCVSHVWKKAEYFAIKSEIQGKINSFVGELESNTTIRFPRVSVKLIRENKEEFVWEDSEAIIVMQDRKNKTKNFIHAAYFFTSETLLRKSKRHLSKTQKVSLDLFVARKILEHESKAINKECQ